MKGQKQSQADYLKKVQGETIKQISQLEGAMGWAVTQIQLLQEEVKKLKGEETEIEAPKLEFKDKKDD